MDYKQLYEKAISIQSKAVNGIYKDIKEYAFVFVYPPPQTLYKISQSNLPKGNESHISKPVNVYIHIPYCTGKCKYCYFCTYELSMSPVFKSVYVDLLCKEIELINKIYGRLNICSIHFGGGTPTTLSDKEFDSIFKALHDNMNISKEIEITCESSPETLTVEKIKNLLNLGVNRLNIGIQTLDDSILKYINRRHNGKQALEAIDIAHSKGFTNVNVDLIYGLPGQTLELWGDNLKKIIGLGLQSISTYRLRIHPYGELTNEKNLQKENELIGMYVRLLQIMDEAGYVQSSSHKFALKREFVQKQIINKRGIKNNELVSIGMSSYGYIGNTLYWNYRDINNYRERLINSELPCALGYELDKIEQMSKACVLGIHNLDGIDIGVFEPHFGIKFEEIYGKFIEYLKREELIDIIDSKLKLTKLGMIFADEIAIQFYSDTIKSHLNKKGLRYGMFFNEIL